MREAPVVGIAAQSFGFGPASKAVTVGRLLQWTYGCVLLPLGEGLAYEYFEREGLRGHRPLHPRHRRDLGDLEGLTAEIDGLVVALDPEWVEFGVDRLPTFFLDSLGFMWAESHFDDHPALSRTRGYFVQDLFGAADAISRFGLANAHPTSGIVARPAEVAATNRSALFFHLGGLFNIYGEASGLEYLSNVVPMLVQLQRRARVARTAMSKQALHQGLVPSSLRPGTLTNGEVAIELAAARAVVSSPGLTTLLECAAVGAAFLPLPPQNWSQALILHHMASRHDSHDLWTFLADAYDVPASLPEEQGVQLVAQRNGELFATGDFADAYVQKAVALLASDEPLTSQLGVPHDGAEVCARLIAEALQLPTVADPVG